MVVLDVGVGKAGSGGVGFLFFFKLKPAVHGNQGSRVNKRRVSRN